MSTYSCNEHPKLVDETHHCWAVSVGQSQCPNSTFSTRKIKSLSAASHRKSIRPCRSAWSASAQAFNPDPQHADFGSRFDAEVIRGPTSFLLVERWQGICRKKWLQSPSISQFDYDYVYSFKVILFESIWSILGMYMIAVWFGWASWSMLIHVEPKEFPLLVDFMPFVGDFSANSHYRPWVAEDASDPFSCIDTGNLWTFAICIGKSLKLHGCNWSCIPVGILRWDVSRPWLDWTHWIVRLLTQWSSTI